MWIIFERTSDQARLVGSFKKEPDAQEYLSFLKNARSSYSHELRKISKSDYPIFFIYTEAHGHDYVTQEKLAKLLWFKDADEYTIICEDYRAFEKGNEEYRLPVVDHADNDFIIEDLIMPGLHSEYYMSEAGYYECANIGCGRRHLGSLSQNGYERPPAWQIVPSRDSYRTFCSKKCCEEFLERWEPLLSLNG